MAKTKPFDEHLSEYEQWFSDNHYVFESELEAIGKVMPKKGKGIEIGIGSGVFAIPLGITEGIEPSKVMREKAEERGLHVIDGVAENLPLADKSYDFALMVTTICFVDDVSRSFAEAHRILKENGNLILGFVDKESPVGKLYLSLKEKSIFYKDAQFFSTEEVYKSLWENDFTISRTYQTVFGHLEQVNEVQKAENGYGKGSFVVIKAKKMNISRPTFTRLYDKARKSIAKAFVEGKAIIIQGGTYITDDYWYRCDDCHETIVSDYPVIQCRECDSDNLTQLNDQASQDNDK